MVEIEVQSGGSTYMWQDYFGKGLDYYGLDINPNCKQFARPGITILMVDQSNATQLRDVIRQVPIPDIVLDDGGHSMDQQISMYS